MLKTHPFQVKYQPYSNMYNKKLSLDMRRNVKMSTFVYIQQKVNCLNNLYCSFITLSV
jgi:hypothetical protein